MPRGKKEKGQFLAEEESEHKEKLENAFNLRQEGKEDFTLLLCNTSLASVSSSLGTKLPVSPLGL